METPPLCTKKSLVNNFTRSSLTPCRRVGLGRPSSCSLKKSLLVRTANSSKQTDTPLLEEIKKGKISNEESPITHCDERLKAPLKISDVLNKSAVPRVRRCLSVEHETPLSHQSKRLLPVSEFEISYQSNLLKTELISNLDFQGESSNKKKKKLNLDSSLHLNYSGKLEKASLAENCSSQSTASVVLDRQSTDSKHVPEAAIQEITPEVVHRLAVSVIEKKKKLAQLKVQAAYAKKHDLTELRTQTAMWRAAGQEALRYSVSVARRAGYSVTLPQLMTQHGFPPKLIGYNTEDDEFN